MQYFDWFFTTTKKDSNQIGLDLIFYYSLQKIKLLFDPKRNFWRFIGIICLIFLSFFYGFAVSILTDSSIPEGTEASQIFAFQIIPLIIIFVTIFRAFFRSEERRVGKEVGFGGWEQVY